MGLSIAPIAAQEKPHDFARWEQDIAAFAAADKAAPPEPGCILFVGSSTIRLWKTLETDFPDHRVVNRGFGGSHICDATYFAERLIGPHRPRAIFLRAGGNDIESGKSPERVSDDFREFVQTIRAKLPETDIYYISVAPTVKRRAIVEREKRLNALIAEFCKTAERVTFIDTFDMTLGDDGQPRPELLDPDMLHFNEQGYALLRERVRPHLPK